MNRNTRALIAQDTIDILEKGEYRTSNNRLINISKAIMSSNESTHLYRPEDYNELLAVCRREGRSIPRMQILLIFVGYARSYWLKYSPERVF